jgi:hypothetical protein
MLTWDIHLHLSQYIARLGNYNIQRDKQEKATQLKRKYKNKNNNTLCIHTYLILLQKH